MTELTTEHLIKQFGNRVVLDDINLTLKPNTIYGLLGRNGAGKSTLLSIIANQITASSGTINWDKTPLTGRDHPLQAIYLMSEQNIFNKENRLKKIMKDTALLQGAFNQTLADKMLADFELTLNWVSDNFQNNCRIMCASGLRFSR